MIKLRTYQREALDSTIGFTKGKIILPTGTGKTFIQASLLAEDIKANPGHRIYVVAAPRIMLSFQLQEEFQKVFDLSGVDAQYLFVHSGVPTNKINSWEDELINTTAPKDILTSMEEAELFDSPLVIFTTYHSISQIETAREKGNFNIDITLNDEAHYLSQEKFNSNFNELSSDRTFFFTATEVITPSEEGLGMSNEEIFGKTLFTRNPAWAIENGYMVKPTLVFAKYEGDLILDNNEVNPNLGRFVVETFVDLDSRTSQNAKMMVTAKGTNQISALTNSLEIQDWYSQPNNHFFAVDSSNTKEHYNGSTLKNRSEFLNKLRTIGKDPNANVIVCHYNILTEGIDVPGLHGTLLFRGLSLTNQIQNYGRVARPSEGKDEAYVIIPNFTTEGEDNTENIRTMITNMVQVGFNCQELKDMVSRGSGSEEEDIDDLVPSLEEIEDNMFTVAEKIIFDHEQVQIRKENSKKILNNLMSDNFTPLPTF